MALALYYTTQNLFTILQLYQTRTNHSWFWKKPNRGGQERAKDDDDAQGITRYTPGYLGFVVEIEETQSEGGNLTLQIWLSRKVGV